MAEGVESHALLAGFGAWAGGMLGVGAIYGGAISGERALGTVRGVPFNGAVIGRVIDVFNLDRC